MCMELARPAVLYDGAHWQAIEEPQADLTSSSDLQFENLLRFRVPLRLVVILCRY